MQRPRRHDKPSTSFHGDVFFVDDQIDLSTRDEESLRVIVLRGEYIRVDGDAVSLLWAGSEKDYSGMISDHGGYYKMLNDMMDDLADIADAIPASQ